MDKNPRAARKITAAKTDAFCRILKANSADGKEFSYKQKTAFKGQNTAHKKVCGNSNLQAENGLQTAEEFNMKKAARFLRAALKSFLFVQRQRFAVLYAAAP